MERQARSGSIGVLNVGNLRFKIREINVRLAKACIRILISRYLTDVRVLIRKYGEQRLQPQREWYCSTVTADSETWTTDAALESVGRDYYGQRPIVWQRGVASVQMISISAKLGADPFP